MAKSNGVDDESFICFAEEKVDTTNECLGNNMMDIPYWENDEETYANQSKMNEEQMCNYSLVLSVEDEFMYTGNGQSNEVGSSVASVCNSLAQGNKDVQTILDDMFFSMESSEDGCVQVSDLVDHVKRSVDCDRLPSADVFDDLWSMFDPNGENISVGIERFREVMTLWVGQLQERLSTSNSESNINNKSASDNSLNLMTSTSSPFLSSPINNRQSSFGLIDQSMLINCTFGSLEEFGGDTSQRDHLEMVAELKEMEYQNKMLQERIEKLYFQLNTLEENISSLTEEKQDLKRKLLLYRSSKEKCKELAACIAVLKEDLFKTEIENSNLRKLLDNLKNENALLEAKITNMKEDINTLWTDLEQTKLTRECLVQELCRLNIQVQLLEKEIEMKDNGIVEEQKKCQETEDLVNYWKSRSEEFVAERDKLEIELDQALKDIEGYKRKCLLMHDSLGEERKLINGSSNLIPRKEDGNIFIGNTANFSPLPLRQELEVLLGEDNQLPTPFCEKPTKCTYSLPVSEIIQPSDQERIESQTSELLGEDGDEGVDSSDDDAALHISNDCSSDIPKHIRSCKTQMSTALKLIRSLKIETSSLLSMCQKLATFCAFSTSGECKQKGNWNNETNKITKSDGTARDIISFANTISTNINLYNEFLSQLNGVDSDCEEVASVFNNERLNFNWPMVSVVVQELQNLSTELCTCREIISVTMNNAMFWSKCNSCTTNGIWGKSTNLSQVLASDVQPHSRQDVDHYRDHLSHIYKHNDTSEDMYWRLIADLENDLLVNGSSFENHFYELMRTLAERRASLFKRIQIQNQKRQLTKETVEKLLFSLKFGSLLNNNGEQQIRDLETAISDLSHDSESVGSVIEEMEMCRIFDQIVQYLNRTYRFGNKSTVEQRRKGKQSAGGSIYNQPRCDAEVQCYIDNYDDGVETRTPTIEVNESSSNNRSEGSLQSATNDYISRIMYCLKDKCCDILCNLNWDSHCMGGFILFGIVTIVVLASIVFFVFNIGSSCSKCSTVWDASACSKSWSEIFRPIVQIQPPPNAF
ncbi:hypothetical protein CHUAL_004479 [Chamberlinius hualienensis]